MKCIQLASSYPELINMRMFPDGVTPFHRICFRGNIPVIEFMLAKGMFDYNQLYLIIRQIIR